MQPDRQSLPRVTRVDKIVVAAFVFVSTAVLAVLSLSPRDEERQRALIFAPWTSQSEALRRAVSADVDLVGTGRYPFIVIVALREGETSPGTGGALLSLAANVFGGCLKASLKVTS
jgi:hypothetical protein